MMKKEYYKPTVAVMSIFSQTIMGASDNYSDPGSSSHGTPGGPSTAPARKLYV